MHQFTIIGILVLLFSCEREVQFSKGNELTEQDQSVFISSLEQEIDTSKNGIYCVTFLLAWDKLREELGGEFSISNSNKDLWLINSAKVPKGMLSEDEYKTSVRITSDRISVESELNKKLPFLKPFNRFEKGLRFGKEDVVSFGAEGFDLQFFKDQLNLLYYKDDSNFILQFDVTDSLHDIVLFKTNQSFKNFKQMLSVFYSNVQFGEKERMNIDNIGKYHFNDNDSLLIPILRFDLETHFPSIEGKKITNAYTIEKAWQHVNFELSEQGAKLESEAKYLVSELEPEFHSKKLFFNQPFYVLLKRKNSKHPYLILFISNSDFMIKN